MGPIFPIDNKPRRSNKSGERGERSRKEPPWCKREDEQSLSIRWWSLRNEDELVVLWQALGWKENRVTSADLYVGCPVNLFPKEAWVFSHKQVTNAV